MSDLIKYTEENLQRLCQSLSPVEKQVVLLFSKPNIRNVSTQDIKKAINEAINICYFDLGIKAPANQDEEKKRADDNFSLMKSVFEEINSDPFYNSLRVDEVKKAIKNGSLGKYNDAKWSFIGISTVNLITSIRKYLEDANRSKSMQDFMRLTSKSEESNQPSEIELRAMIRQNIIRSYSKFKVANWFDDPGNMIYNELVKLGHMDYIGEELRPLLFLKAKERLLKQYDYKMVLEKFKRMELKRRFEELAPLEGEELQQDKEVEREYFRVCINHFFANILSMDTPIEDLLDTEED